MKQQKPSALRIVTVWFLTLNLLCSVGTQFWSTHWSKAFSSHHDGYALGQGTWDQAAAHAFPMDEQHHGWEDLEGSGEGGEGTGGTDDTSKGDDFLTKNPWGIQALGLEVSGRWSSIGEKNLGNPLAKYLLYHSLLIPS